MSKELFEHLNKYVSIRSDEFQKIAPFFEVQNLNKKDFLMTAGKKCLYNHFVVNGCLHMYFISDNGIERTVQFAIENWWMTDFLAYQHQSVTDFYIQAVTKTQVLSITHQKQEELLTQFPHLEKYFRQIYQISYGASLVKVKHAFNLSKEEMYFNFIEQFPQFAQRVPQYLIASFLGLTPEYVSEIRSKKRS